jgi:hypothetical protein
MKSCSIHTLRATMMAVAGLGVATATAVEITLPPETARLVESPLPGYALATSMCSTCHSADYISMQPPSSRAYWKGSVTKMQKTFGAPIPDEAVEPITDYLVKTYGTERGSLGAGPNTSPGAAKPSGKSAAAPKK